MSIGKIIAITLILLFIVLSMLILAIIIGESEEDKNEKL